MKKYNVENIFICCMLIVFSLPAYAQYQPGSNIVSRTKLQSRGTRYLEERVYDNGQGDIVREVQSFPGTSFPDIIVRHDYDEYRRKTKTWLPVTSQSGSDNTSDYMISNMAVSQYNDTKPFTLTLYDSFLPSQPSAQYRAGSEWQGNEKKITFAYKDTAMVRFYLHNDDVYTDFGAKYFRTCHVDEDGCPRAEYADVSGRLNIIETSQGKTYYVYDKKGDIRFVIPPALSEYIIYIDSCSIYDEDEYYSMMDKYAYIYRYDYKRNCIYKKLPGCEPIYYIYDKAGNCIFSQDGNQRQRREWTYTIPDKFGRPAISGICHNSMLSSSSSSSQHIDSLFVYAEYNGINASFGGYNVMNLTLVDQTLYSAAYYDGYSFIGQHGIPSMLAAHSVSGFTIDSLLGRGLQTGSATAYFNENGVAGYTYSAMYYDSRYNVAQVVSTNHLGRCDITSTKYSYTGKPTNMVINHNLRDRGEKETYTYTYDDADRLSMVKHKMDNGSEKILLQNTYNNLGQLVSNTNSCFTTYYTYDIHSWLKNISVSNQNTLFIENLKYTDTDNPCFNGNISAMIWQNRNTNTQRYDYIYDDASRLINASYSDGNNGSSQYSTQYTYDCMGNITSLMRNGLLDDDSYGLIDDLTLNYDGNQLMAVNDSGDDPSYNNAWNFMDGADSETEYEYDANGNITKDLNRNILSIQYNSLNLPSRIDFARGKTIKYTYSADGRKLRAEYTSTVPLVNKTIDYCGNLVFENGVLKQMLFDGGYVPVEDRSGAYVFYVKDHLGNNRMAVNQNGTIEQTNNYYPYGGLMANSTGWTGQRYKYNGKEFDRMHGLDWYDYGARWMDASIGRWHSMDPLAERYYDVSPYVYCNGNPTNQFDPDGKSPVLVGALTGAALDYGLQVASNLVQGKSIRNSLTNVDVKSIAISAISGAAGVGLTSKVRQVFNVTKIGNLSLGVSEMGVNATVGAATSIGSQYINNGKVSGKNVIIDAGASVIAGKAGKYVQNVLKKNSSAYKISLRDANHKARVARGASRVSRVERARVATKKAEEFGSKRSTIVSGSVSVISSKPFKQEDK